MTSTPARSPARNPARSPAPGFDELEPKSHSEQAGHRRSTPARSTRRLQNGYAVLSPPRSVHRQRSASTWPIARRLTTRDRQILQAVHRLRVLTTEQLLVLFFTSLQRARTRLVALHRLGLLDRFEPADPDGRRKPFHYVLGRQGAAVLAAEAGRDPTVVARRFRPDRQVALAQSQRLAHRVGVNDLYCALTRHAECLGDTLDWLTEPEATRWVGEIVRPDAFLAWTNEHGTVECFVEYDRGTEPLNTLVRKLDDYERLEAERGGAAWVLFVFLDARREQTARGALADATVSIATGLAAGPSAAPTWRPLLDRYVEVDLSELARIPFTKEALARAAIGSERAWRFDRSRQPTNDKEPPLDHMDEK